MSESIRSSESPQAGDPWPASQLPQSGEPGQSGAPLQSSEPGQPETAGQPSGPREPAAFLRPLITSRRNPVVGRFRALHESRGRRDQGRVLLEGTHLIEEAARLGLAASELLATPAWIEAHQALLHQHPAMAAVLQPVDEAVLAAAATTQHPDGVVLSLDLPRPAAPARPGFVLALEQLQDPGNLGTLMRTALAAGVEALWLAGGADPWQPKVVRASAGAALTLPLERLAGLALRLQQARAQGVQVVATAVTARVGPTPPASAPSATGPSGTGPTASPSEATPSAAGASAAGTAALPYWQLDWTLPTVLLLGNEGAGLSADLLSCCSHRVTIPHSAAVESLNVAVAAGPLLLERWRQQQERMPVTP